MIQSNCFEYKPPAWKIQLILIIGLMAYASGAIFVRLAIAYDQADGIGFSLFLAASRMAIATLCCLPALRGFAKSQYSRHELFNSAMAGIFLALYFATWITSLSFTSIAASTTLVNLNPLWVMFLSWLWLRRKPRKITLLGVGVTTSGAVLISLGTNTAAGYGRDIAMGNGLALFGSFAIAGYILFGHVAQQANLQLRHHMVVMYATAAIFLMPLPMLFSTSYLNHQWQTYGCITLMALITQLLGHTCLNWVVKWINPTLVSILLLTEPILASGLGYLTFGEVPTLSVAIGGIVIFLGLSVAILGQESVISFERHSSRLDQEKIPGNRSSQLSVATKGITNSKNLKQ